MKCADDGGEWAHIVIGGVLGAAFGAFDAYVAGENVLAGAIIGGAGGAISAAVGPLMGVAVAVGEEIISQGVQHSIKQQNGTTDEPIKMDWISVGFAGLSSFTLGWSNYCLDDFLNDTASKIIFEYVSDLYSESIDFFFGVTQNTVKERLIDE